MVAHRTFTHISTWVKIAVYAYSKRTVSPRSALLRLRRRRIEIGSRLEGWYVSGWLAGEWSSRSRDCWRERGIAYIRRMEKEKMILDFLEVGIRRSWIMSAEMIERLMSRRLLMTAYAIHRFICESSVSEKIPEPANVKSHLPKNGRCSG
jgi:hypothetical protein